MKILKLLLFVSLFIFLSSCNNTHSHPIPTDGKTKIYLNGEVNENHDLKKCWFDALHQTAPNTNWRKSEADYAIQKQNNWIRNNSQYRFGDQEIIGDGLLYGSWFERGSNNQAGSVFDVEYDQKTDELYVIAAGGSLFKGKRDGSIWAVLNDKLKFDNGLLKFIKTDNGRRLLALSNKTPYFSDDDGLTWNPSVGVNIQTSFAKTFDPIVIENSDHNTIYLLSKPDYWDNLLLYKSVDNGTTYSVVHSFTSEVESKIKLCNPHNTKDLYVLSLFGKLDLSRIDIQTDEFTFISNLSDIENTIGRIALAGTYVDNQLTLLTYAENNFVYKSKDNGITWSKNGKMPNQPWDVGLYVSKYDSNKRFAGGVECYKTTNLPTFWETVNTWDEYYQNIDTKIHADIMAFHEFETEDGTPFILVSNHGGLSISYDNLETNQNIGLNGLNVSQYYDVITDYSDPENEIIYAGSQDQGFQIGSSTPVSEKDPIDFVQYISGDYGHLILTHDNSLVWKMYPDGWVTATDSEDNYYSYEINSENETVWIPPMVKVPSENAILIAGGSITGGAGSFIIKITLEDIKSSNAVVTQLPYNFIEYAGSEISAIAVSPFDPNTIYVATNNSLFFYSYDGGETFTQSLDPVPGAHFLYGSVILPSKKDENVVYMAGSGYSNPPVFKSIDKGKSFARMDNGMPPTLVYDMDFNEDETLIFAGTESAPYVYVVSEEKWYDMSGQNAPTQTYWSVEYLKNQKKVRFGTYGRGIWDFQIQDPVETKNVSLGIQKLKLFPNPTKDIVHIPVLDLSGDTKLQIVDINGCLVYKDDIKIEKQEQITINLNNLVTGRYILTIQDKNHYFTSKLIKQ